MFFIENNAFLKQRLLLGGFKNRFAHEKIHHVRPTG